MKLEKDLHILLMKFINKTFYRFIFVGMLNTIFSYIVYLICLLIMEYNFAYTISYILGILFSYYLNVKFVFSRKFTLNNALKFPLAYIFQYFCSIFILNFIVTLIPNFETIAPLIITIILTPLLYITNKYLII